MEISNAALEGLTKGVSANELLVSNGEDQSFSVIMSGPTADLPDLWNTFVNSVSVTPSDCCTSDPSSGRVLGVENACEAEVEVTINEDPSIEQPQHPWVMVRPGDLEKVATIDVPNVALFVSTPDAPDGQVYEYSTDEMIKATGGSVDLLIRVTDDFCPTIGS